MFQSVCVLFLLIFCFNLSVCFEEAWEAYQIEMRYASREELVVTSVTADENFKVQADVKKWTSISVGPTCYSIGILDKGLAVLVTTQNFNNTNLEVKFNITELTKRPLEVTILQNIERESIDIILVVIFENDPELKWYKVHNTELESLWTWNLTQPLIHINSFSLESKKILLLATNSTQNSSRVDLYQYELQNNNYWLVQSLHVSTPITSSAFNNFELDFYLSIPQKPLGLVGIYKLKDTHFVYYNHIRSKNVEKVVSFEIGFESFLAIDGSKAGIYRFRRDHLKRERIINSNLNGMAYWLPVPLKTYREEVVLFAQRVVDHSSHLSHVIEIITFNGMKFEEHDDIPCRHFGEEANSLTCLSEGAGIIGSSFVAAGDEIGLIIPRSSNESILFIINYTINQVSNPLEAELNSLAKEKKKIQRKLEKYEAMKKSSRALKMVEDSSQQILLSREAQNENSSFIDEEVETIGKSIEELKAKVDKIVDKENNTEYNMIIINGKVEIEGEGKFGNVEIEKINGESVSGLLDDIVRRDSTRKISGDKTANTLKVQSISFDKVNGIEANELVFLNDSPVTLTGDITVHDTAQIENVNLLSKRINDMDLLSEIVDMKRKYNGSLHFHNVKVNKKFEAVTINNGSKQSIEPNHSNTLNMLDLTKDLNSDVLLNNLNVTNINGEDFDIFIRQLCLVNIKCYIPGELKINGNIVAEKASVSYLNDVKFPEEYIFKEQDAASTITGRKIFAKSLTAKGITSRGKIDAVDTKKLVTFSDDQKIPAKITFSDVEVSEELNVTGKIMGQHIDKLLPNPTLQHTPNITSNINFRVLEVDGDIIIENNLNNENFEATLSDIIYKDEHEVHILGSKEFPNGFTVKENLELKSNSINKVNLDEIVTKDTDQFLNVTILNGDVVIDNAEIRGTFGGENVTQLDQNLVKLTGEQYISSTLTFEEDLEVQNLEVTDTLNEISVEKYFDADGNRKVDGNVTFDDMEVEDITVQGNFTGSIAEIDVGDFAERYLSYSKDQIIETHYNIVQSTVDNLRTQHINGEVFDDYFNPDKFAEQIKEMLRTGNVKVEDLYVNGTLEIDSANEISKSDWLITDFLVDSNGNRRENFTIEGNIYFNTLAVDKLSGIQWDWHNKQLIYKNETTTVIGAPTINFLGGIKVVKLIETEKLNDILIDNILTKEGSQRLSGPISIKGAASFRDAAIKDNLNEVGVSEILDNLDIKQGTYYLKDDVLFSELSHIHNLDIDGFANDKNISEHFSEVVNLHNDSILHEDIIFEKPVEIVGNLAIEQNLNDIDLSDFENQIVLTTKDTEVESPVAFLESVVIRGNLSVEEDLITHTLYGFNLMEWQNNAVYVDQGLMNGSYKFDAVNIKNTLTIDYLNDMNMESIVPLSTSQTINYLEFEEVRVNESISVLGLVNGYDNLAAEFEVTALTDKDQRIDSKITFNNITLIRNNLSTLLINDKDVSKIVTINTDQTLTSNFNFKTQCRMDSDLKVYGLINGVNITVWQQKNVKIWSSEVQEIYDDWNIAQNLTFAGNVDGGVFINDLDLARTVDEIEERKEYKYKFENDIIENYKNVCIDVSHMYTQLKKQIYKFMYFDDLQTIKLSNTVQFAHYFMFGKDHFLLVNENNCLSHLYIFRKRKFEHYSAVETGHIGQVVLVLGNNSIFLVTADIQSNKKCDTKNTNVWQFDGEEFQLYYNIDEPYLLQESQVPFTFYGLNKQGVIEFKVNYNVPRRYRKWKVFKDNAAFIPRGLKAGLALRTGRKVVSLDRSDPIEDDFSLDSESVIIGNTSEIDNYFIPGRKGGDIVVTNVGIKSARRSLFAVASHEETSVRGRLDFVKVYNDVFNGDLFHKVPAYKPSSLLSIEFDQGETLLVFMENERTLQIYEYKGIEGFKHRLAAKLDGSKLFLMTLPIEPYLNPRKSIGIVHKNTIKIVQSIMSGNRIRDDLKCEL